VTAVAVLVVAKAPVPGLAKTRLAATIGAEAAAEVAAAALLDTLDAVVASAVSQRIVAMTGKLSNACRGIEIRERLVDFTVIEQSGDDFAQRLVNAHADAAAAAGGLPVLQIGMDTPQVTGKLIADCSATLLGTDAVLGMASDGGWWALGVTHASMARCLLGVPMSTAETGAVTLAALRHTGLDVELLPELGDVDTIDDIAVVRRACVPGSRFDRATRAAEV
jgi:glycosyltransferase A (GT-A) superfamily protein (DUF2064 family)